MKSNTLRLAAIDTPKEKHGFTLYPASFALLEWLQIKRKNPLIIGGKAELRHAIELCFCFTRPSEEITKLPEKALVEEVENFKHVLGPVAFRGIQAHAQAELLKYSESAVAPKKPRVRAQPKARK